MIGYAYPGGGVKLPYAELRVPPERLECDQRHHTITQLTNELAAVVGAERAEHGTLHEWADRHGLTIVRLVSDLPAVAA